MDNHIIVRETSSEIRAISRNALQDNWMQVFIGIVVYYLLNVSVPELLALIIPGNTEVYYNEFIGTTYEVQTQSFVSSFYNMFLTGAFTAGLCVFMLAFFRRRDINPGYIFSGFEFYIKTLGLFLLQGVFIFLWTLLLIVPGIIAAIRYSQAFYILSEDPSKGIMQCINESKMLMDGNKSKYFCLVLSFIGWGLLSALISGIIVSAFGILTAAVPFIHFIVTTIAMIPVLFVYVYANTAQVVFYDLVTGNLVAKRPEISVEEDYNF